MPKLTEAFARKTRLLPAGQKTFKDEALKGFWLVVGKARKSWVAHIELPRKHGVRQSKHTVLGVHPDMTAEEARTAALDQIADWRKGKEKAGSGPTLKEAWERYRDAKLLIPGKSPRSLEAGKTAIEVRLKDYLHWPLAELSNDTEEVSDLHARITAERGPVAANHTIRVLNVVYGHARLRNRKELPPELPGEAVELNPEEEVDDAMDAKTLVLWHRDLIGVEERNPIRAAYHLFCLLSALRRDHAKSLRREYVDFEKRVITLPPFKNRKKAWEFPLSAPMVETVQAAIAAGDQAYPGTPFLFPAKSKTGHLWDNREPGLRAKGHTLRRTYIARALTLPGIGLFEVGLLTHTVDTANMPARYAGDRSLGQYKAELQDRISAELMKGAVKILYSAPASVPNSPVKSAA